MLVTFAAFTVVRVRQVVGTPGSKPKREHFPAAAVAFLSREHPPGPILNHYNWGGYFIWKLYPEYRVFMDGRADVYGDTFMDEFAALLLPDGTIGECPSADGESAPWSCPRTLP